jgi:hypothetical protein
MPSSRATASAAPPRLTVHSDGNFGLIMRQPTCVCQSLASVGYGTSGFGSTNGARLMLSTPPATIRSASPDPTARAAWTIASPPDAQSRFTVTPGTVTGSPASRAAMRATLRLSSPAPLVSPRITSSTRPSCASAG